MLIWRAKLALPRVLAFWVCVLEGALVGPASAQCPAVSATTPATAAAIESTLRAIKDKYQLNAVLLDVERNGEPLHRTALGLATDGVPATPELHFRIGGVGWQVLSTVLLRLVEQDPGRLALSDRVNKWFPHYPHADQATVRMLAASSAGFGDYITPDAFVRAVEADPLRVWTADDLIDHSVVPYQTPQFAEPGRNWQYSHTDFVVLGAILEKVTGKPYARLLQELVLDPLGLRDTRFQLDARPQLPVLHTLQEGDFRDSTFWNPSFVSWAALTSTLCDLGAWTRAFGAGALLSPEMQSEVRAPVNVRLGGNTAKAYFGLGTLIYPPWVVQRAAYWGMYTTTAYDTTTGLTLAASVSLSRGTPADVQPSNEIITAVSQLLTPDHPVPR